MAKGLKDESQPVKQQLPWDDCCWRNTAKNRRGFVDEERNPVTITENKTPTKLQKTNKNIAN